MAAFHIAFASDRVFDSVDAGFARLTILPHCACFDISGFAAEPRLALGAAKFALLAIPVLLARTERSY